MTQRRNEPNNRAPQQRINEMIRIPQIRVISEEGEQLGVMNTSEALNLARNSGLDLVEVSSDSQPPVCRIMDYGKYKYQQKKRQSKQHAHQTKTKEIRVRPKTGDHDLNVKINKARQFLNEKDKVQISVMFRGREMAHIDEGEKVIQGIIEKLEDIAKVESPPKAQGKRISCTLSPK